MKGNKDFDQEQIDALELLLSKLYSKCGITDKTDYDRLKPTDYPIMSNLYELAEEEYKG